MPKELIRDVRTDYPKFAVEVAWGHFSTVQIGVVDTTADKDSTMYGWFMDLDRGKINNLIRILRRARDQAFGVDE